MKQWLRANPQHAPEGKDPFDAEINSQTWRRVLVRNGWRDKETNTEVHLIFPAENEEEDTETPSATAFPHDTTTHGPSHLTGLPDMRRRGKKYLVVFSEEEKYPMKEWLRGNSEHNPEGMHPDTHTSQQLRYGLKRNGWVDEEKDTEVHLIFPTEDEEEHVETPSAFALEHHLRDFIANNIEKMPFGRKLKLYEGRNAIEYPTDTGRIDILAVSADNNQDFFVIELKLSRGSDQAIGQLTRYMSWVEDNIENCNQVNGIIIAQAIDERLQRSARMISSQVFLYEYMLKFDLSRVFSSPRPDSGNGSAPTPTPPKPRTPAPDIDAINKAIEKAAAEFEKGEYPSIAAAFRGVGVTDNQHNRQKFKEAQNRLKPK